LNKVVPFPRPIPNQEDTADPLQRAEKAIKTAHDLVSRNKSRIAQEIDAALDNLESQLKLVGDMIHRIPDAATRERLAKHHAILTVAGRELRFKKDTLGLGSPSDEIKLKTEPSD
jgi:hypothetical protein